MALRAHSAMSTDAMSVVTTLVPIIWSHSRPLVPSQKERRLRPSGSGSTCLTRRPVRQPGPVKYGEWVQTSSADSERIAHTKATCRIRSLPPRSILEGATEYDESCPAVEKVTYKNVGGQSLDGERSGAETMHAVGAVG